jgi:hypothetical protein
VNEEPPNVTLTSVNWVRELIVLGKVKLSWNGSAGAPVINRLLVSVKSKLSAKAVEENAKNRIGAARHKRSFLTKPPNDFDQRRGHFSTCISKGKPLICREIRWDCVQIFAVL